MRELRKVLQEQVAGPAEGYSFAFAWRISAGAFVGLWIYDTYERGHPNPAGTITLVLLLAGVGWLERTRARLRRETHHMVTIFHVAADDYFFAQCDDCGWSDAPHDSAASARHAGESHTNRVKREVVSVDPSHRHVVGGHS
jgi:hypothetical protein